MPNTYLSKDYTTNPTNGAIANFSVWLKRGNLGARNKIIGAYDGGAAGQYLEFFTDNTIRYHSGNGLNTTNAVFRDTSAWYHIVVLHNTGGSGASNQVKIWVNGNLQSLSTNSGATVNSQIGKNSVKTVIGVEESAYSSSYFDGSMSHFHFIDGTAYDATAFGQYDANGVWKIKTSPSVTYGTNGFFILKDGNSVTDQSPNTNNFTVGGGTLTNTEDSPSNVFSTWNSLLSYGSTMSLANGNTTANTSSSHEASKFLSFYNSLGMTNGKYYAEFKITSNANQSLIGISSNFGDDVLGSTSSAYNFIYKGNGWGYYGSNGNVFHTNSDTQLSYGNSLANNDILGVALDLDNLKLYFSKNGVWQNSANPVTGSGDVVSAGAKALNGSGSTGTYFFSCADFDQGAVCNVQANFGNGYFGTTAVSSAGTNASGIGIFEYDVPTGYTALSTKGLNL